MYCQFANGTCKDGRQLEMDDECPAKVFEAENERMAGEALRVLAVAYANDQRTHDCAAMRIDISKDSYGSDSSAWRMWCRNGVKNLISTFHRAGIDTVMITGDQSPTAYAIGKELNLSNGRGTGDPGLHPPLPA